MAVNDEKKKAIYELYGLRASRSGEILTNLLDICLQEMRLANDMVERDRLAYNQGQIAAYLELKKWLEKGLPSFNELKA